jgi:hypothetical protein
MSPFRYLTSAPQAGCISRYLTRDRDGVYGNEGKVRFVSNRTLEPMTEYTSEVTLELHPTRTLEWPRKLIHHSRCFSAAGRRCGRLCVEKLSSFMIACQILAKLVADGAAKCSQE